MHAELTNRYPQTLQVDFIHDVSEAQLSLQIKTYLS